MRKRCWLLAFGCWLAPSAVLAVPDSITTGTALDGERSSKTPPPAGLWWMGAWAGAALRSEFETREGPRHRDFYMAGIRLGRQLPVSRLLAIDYFIDVVPLLVSTNNPVRYREVPCGRAGAPTSMPMLCGYAVMETATTRGYGVTPIGIQLRVFPGSRIQPMLGLSIGAAWYHQPVPDPGERRLNFMGDLAVGVQIRTGRSGAVVAGVRQHHTSNAGTGRVNPGLDTSVLHLGATRSLGRRAQQ